MTEHHTPSEPEHLHTNASEPGSAADPAPETSAEAAAVQTMSPEEREAERKQLRRLQMMMNLVMQTIAQDGTLSVDDASQMIADSRRAALSMFPGKELAYDLIWRPRFQRLMRERFHLN